MDHIHIFTFTCISNRPENDIGSYLGLDILQFEQEGPYQPSRFHTSILEEPSALEVAPPPTTPHKLGLNVDLKYSRAFVTRAPSKRTHDGHGTLTSGVGPEASDMKDAHAGSSQLAASSFGGSGPKVLAWMAVERVHLPVHGSACVPEEAASS